MRKVKEIEKYLDVTEGRVGFVRKLIAMNKIISGEDIAPHGIDQATWNTKRMELIKTGLESCRKKFEGEGDCDLTGMYEYNEGVMAALRWVLGDEKDSLDT